MPNANYIAGRALEYQIIKILKENLNPDKYTIIRTAGSHSPVDVVVLKHDGEYLGIQAKKKKGKTDIEKFSKQFEEKENGEELSPS